MGRKYRRYVGYATGEIVLVIAGILIALRIDTWHEERQTQRAVDEYLQSIARNIQEDIAEIEGLRARREAALFASKVSRWNLGRNTAFTVAEIKYASDALALAREQHYFNANTSGYEGLKNSGYLSSLSSREIEALLFRYYDVVANIGQLEQDHNDYLTGLSLQFMSNTYDGLLLVFREPEFLSEEEFNDAEIQSAYRDLLNDPIIQAWYEGAELKPLLRAYEQLLSLGRAYIDLVQRRAGDRTEYLSEPEIYDPNDGTGYAGVVRDGRLSWHTYTVDWTPNTAATNPYNRGNFGQFIDTVSFDDGILKIYYPGTDHLTGPPWGGIYIYIGGASPSHARRSRDFSEYSTLRLEMRGSRGGEQFFVNLKDRDDPDDGTQTNIAVTLSDEWQTYDFDLESFENADLTKLYNVAAFLFLDQQEPLSFSVRNITYLRPGER